MKTNFCFFCYFCSQIILRSSLSKEWIRLYGSSGNRYGVTAVALLKHIYVITELTFHAWLSSASQVKPPVTFESKLPRSLIIYLHKQSFR